MYHLIVGWRVKGEGRSFYYTPDLSFKAENDEIAMRCIEIAARRILNKPRHRLHSLVVFKRIRTKNRRVVRIDIDTAVLESRLGAFRPRGKSFSIGRNVFEGLPIS